MSRRYVKQFTSPTGDIATIALRGIILAAGDGAPTASAVGYAKQCQYYDYTNGATYVNTGNNTSATWVALSSGGAGSFTNLTVSGTANIANSNTTGTATIATAAVTNGTVSGTLTFSNAANVALGTGSGTMVGTASNQKIGLWGATPVVQQSSTGETTGGASLAANNNASLVYATNISTFNGNSGTKAYTINDIVKALKTIGVLSAS